MEFSSLILRTWSSKLSIFHFIPATLDFSCFNLFCSRRGDEETVVLVFCGISVDEVVILRVDSVDEVVILRVEEAIFCDADADDRDAGIEVAIFGGVGVDEVAIFGAVAVEKAIFCGVSVDEVVIFRDADVDDRDTGVKEAIFHDVDANDRYAGVEVAIFGGVGVDGVAIFGGVAVEEAIFCGVDVDEVAIFRDADADDHDASVEVAIFGGVGVDEVAIFCGASVDDSAIFGGGVFGFNDFLRVIIGVFFSKKKEIFCTDEEIGPPFISIFYYQIRLSTINDQLHLNFRIKLDFQLIKQIKSDLNFFINQT
ncbi:uncharacterized protein OCT59_010330 [Rhizophagus irregularis]|uniref:uncharacterized protein n=1 Tax=Rhizophagus irregularis TaxID=588596 RepID=UPI00331FF119|nr:hypothetical protein OCT59_010330 [Rhizophagus irregularis]